MLPKYTLRFYALTSQLFIILNLPVALSQNSEIAIGQWRHHLPSSAVVSLAEKPGFIYAATPFGLLEYNKAFNSIRKFDKVDGLSDFGINVIRYSPQKNLLFMGYQNGTIDVMQGENIFSFSDIRQANIMGSKAINSMIFDQNRVYLACDFGIVVLDIDRFIILDTWFIGPQGSLLRVYDIQKTSTHFYAATEIGLFRAPVNAPNLADFNFWTRVPGLSNGKYTFVLTHNNILLANLSRPQGDILYRFDGGSWNLFDQIGLDGFELPKTSIRSVNGFLLCSSYGRFYIFNEQGALFRYYDYYADEFVNANDALIDKEGTLWIGDNRQGIIRGIPGAWQGDFESIIPSGPVTNESFGLAHNGRTLWVAPGSIIGIIGNAFSDKGIFVLNKGTWNSFTRWTFPALFDVRDFHQITTIPGNPKRVYAAAWLGGIAEFDEDQGLINYYDHTNSTLQRRTIANDFIRVGGTAFDSRGNLWASNSGAERFLSVRKTDGNWISFSHNGNVGSNEVLGRIIVDNFDQKWVGMPNGGGIIVFKEANLDGNNPSFNIRKLSTQEGNGSLPSTRVTALAKDREGYIWVGTNAGVVVFYSPQGALRGQAFDAQSIIVVQDGFNARLFDNETINNIFVDGSNKKWFATLTSGAFLLSPDGRETIRHFNTRNSPLPSNNILDISADPQTGEVFFATDRGLVSWRGFAIEGGQQHSDVFVYPNPVRPGYNGFIAISGLVTNARVKITDIAGNLVYDGFADGGQFVWNGVGVHGQKPSSGVYLVFSTNPDGSETMVSKIMFLR